MENNPLTKTCNRCLITKPIELFSIKTWSKDGRQPKCKICSMIGFKEYRDKTARSNAEFKFSVNPSVGLLALKTSSLNKNMNCSLTKESLKNWWLTAPDFCFYCSMTFEEINKITEFCTNYEGNDSNILSLKRILKGKFAMTDFTVDRIDSTKGYEIENMVKCCWFCNSTKGSILTVEETKLIGSMIRSRLLSYLTK